MRRNEKVYQVHDGQHRLYALKQLGLDDWECDCSVTTMTGTVRMDIPVRQLEVDPQVQRESFSLGHALEIVASLSNGHSDLDALGQFSVSLPDVPVGRRAVQFLRRNNVRAINATDRFRQIVRASHEVEGYELEAALDEALTAAGYEVTGLRGPRGVRFATAAVGMARKYGVPAVVDGLDFYSSAFPDADEITGVTACALIEFLARWPQANRASLLKRVAGIGHPQVIVGKARARRATVGGTVQDCALVAVVELYNTGKRTSRIEL